MSLCNFPTFSFAFTLPGFAFPSLDIPLFDFSFTLFCPLD